MMVLTVPLYISSVTSEHFPVIYFYIPNEEKNFCIVLLQKNVFHVSVSHSVIFKKLYPAITGFNYRMEPASIINIQVMQFSVIFSVVPLLIYVLAFSTISIILCEVY